MSLDLKHYPENLSTSQSKKQQLKIIVNVLHYGKSPGPTVCSRTCPPFFFLFYCHINVNPE